MKKAALILLICVYSLATMGFNLKEFYCCGKLKSVTVVVDNFPKSGCKSGNNDSGCCKNNFQYFKIKDNYFAANDNSDFQSPYPDLFIPVNHFLAEELNIRNDLTVTRGHSPPLITNLPLYISNRVFRIWFFLLLFCLNEGPVLLFLSAANIY